MIMKPFPFLLLLIEMRALIEGALNIVKTVLIREEKNKSASKYKREPRNKHKDGRAFVSRRETTRDNATKNRK